MSPSTEPPSCSFTRTARIVPLTRPQMVRSCAMTVPSICAPSPISSSEARNSPLTRPKTCEGPLHSMLPTIDIPEPMQERVAAFVVGSRFGEGCSTTAFCSCTALATTSATFAATSFSFSGALLLNISHLRLHYVQTPCPCLHLLPICASESPTDALFGPAVKLFPLLYQSFTEHDAARYKILNKRLTSARAVSRILCV